jgi:hypothetical protein
MPVTDEEQSLAPNLPFPQPQLITLPISELSGTDQLALLLLH